LSRSRQALIVLALASGPASASEVQPLAEGWAIQSSARLGEGAEGARLSRPGVDTSGWHPARVPTTVLAALVEAGALPDPYYGDNLTRIPGYQKAPWLLMARDSPFRPQYRVTEVPAAWAATELHLDVGSTTRPTGHRDCRDECG
jgi:exo-1,4-beta-D-glucosaminidase